MQEHGPESPARGRAAARADGRADAARRAGRELLVPAPPGGVRVGRRALRRAATWSTWPAARATASTCWPGAPDRSPAWTPTRRPTSTRALKYTRPGVALRARPGGELRRALRRGRVPPDDRARGGSRGGAAPLPRHAAAGRDRVRLDAQPAHARPARRRQVRQPLAPAGVPRRGVPRALRERLRDVELLGLFHSRVLRAHELALRAGWDRVHAALGITKPFYDRFTPAISASDFALRGGPARAGARLRRGAPLTRRREPRGARARAPLAHALRGGLRHLAVRRGVAVGGRGVRVPAAARPARRRAGDGRAHAGAVRPARGDARRAGRALPALPARDPRADPRRGRRRARRRRASPSSPPRCAARPATTRARSALRGARARPPRRLRRARAAWSCGPRPPPMRCCRCSPPTPACGSSWPRARRRTCGASASGAAASGCRSAPTRRGSSASWPTTGCARSASTRRRWTGFDHLEPVATEPGPVAVPIDWETVAAGLERRERLPGAPALQRLQGPNGPRPAAVEQLGRALRPRGGAGARTRARARLRRAAWRSGCDGGGLLCCALDTELLGHWWYEGPAWLGAVLEEAEPQGVRLVTVSEGIERPSRWRGAGPVHLGHRQGLHHLGRAGRGGAGVRRPRARSCAPWRPWPATGAPRAALERAARELLAMQASDWAFMVTRDLAGTTRASG